MTKSTIENPAEVFATAIKEHEAQPSRRYNEGGAMAVHVRTIRACRGDDEVIRAQRTISERLALRFAANKASA